MAKGDEKPEKQVKNTSFPNKATQWKPGQSGNPKGRPKKKTFREIVRDKLWQKHPDFDATNIEVLADKAIEAALDGSLGMFQEIFDREDPKTKKIELDDKREMTVEQEEARIAELQKKIGEEGSDAD